MENEILDVAPKSKLRMGVLEQSLGIKAGSEEFHALEHGHALHKISGADKINLVLVIL